MTECSEIEKIIKNPNKENLTIDFKKSDVIKSNGGQKKLLEHIVSFANKDGGRILIGINDDGTYEGKNIFDVDKDKGTINNIINDKIRPVLMCDIEFISCNEGDVIVIIIPKMKNIPHAWVNKTHNGEIRSREYYIRTPHGKRLISDRQLQYLFKNEKFEFFFPFKFTLKLNKDTLRVDFDSDFDFLLEDLSSITNYDDFFRELEKEDISKIKEYGVTKTISEVFPFIVISTLSKYFMRSWALKPIENERFTTNFSPPKEKFTKLDIPDPIENSILKQLSIDLREYLKTTWLFHEFYIPPEMKISIKKSLLSFQHSDFLFKFDIQFINTSSVGFPEGCISITLNGFYEVKFNLPETNFGLFEDYYQFALSIKEIIKKDLDYDSFLEKNSFKILESMNKKLDRLLTS
ncbi:hypothetical protein ES705_07228 [subsurface metagenome]